MSFEVIPAVDVAHGRAARFTSEGPIPVENESDPVRIAAVLVERGAAWLHLVDLDLAFDGVAGNLELVAKIRAEFPGLGIQAAGGLGDLDQIESALGAGADRAVLASRALADPDTVAEIMAAVGSRLIIGLETSGGRLSPRGETIDLELMETVGWLVGAGATGFLLTAVDRVGSLEGPDVATARRVARSGLPTLAAGGISSGEDLVELRTAGLAGAIVGRAALQGLVDLGTPSEDGAWNRR